jgi:AcrR family transcriptional regulator
MVNPSSESDFSRTTVPLKGEGRRGAIPQAAIVEFASEGQAGARTEAIARAAGVNKALLHDYFSGKHALCESVLDEVFRGLEESGMAGERVFRHFLMLLDRLANYRHLTGFLLHGMVLHRFRRNREREKDRHGDLP